MHNEKGSKDAMTSKSAVWGKGAGKNGNWQKIRIEGGVTLVAVGVSLSMVLKALHYALFWLDESYILILWHHSTADCWVTSVQHQLSLFRFHTLQTEYRQHCTIWFVVAERHGQKEQARATQTGRDKEKRKTAEQSETDSLRHILSQDALFSLG